jgi:hypothetical protein
VVVAHPQSTANTASNMPAKKEFFRIFFIASLARLKFNAGNHITIDHFAKAEMCSEYCRNGGAVI